MVFDDKSTLVTVTISSPIFKVSSSDKPDTLVNFMIVSVDDNPAWSTKNIAGVVTPEVNNVLALIVNTTTYYY